MVERLLTNSHGGSNGGEQLEPRYQNDIELHVKEVEKKRTQIVIENRGYTLAGFDLFEK